MTQPKQALDILLAGAQRAQRQREVAIEGGKAIAAEREAERLAREQEQAAQS